MKAKSILIALPALLMCLTAMASGTHAGGHDDEAIGKPGVAAKVTRTVSIDMTDSMRFSAAKIKAKQGETIRFVVKNLGKVKHEMVLGTAKELKEHYEVMKKNPEMEHADANMVTVAPGETGFPGFWHEVAPRGEIGFGGCAFYATQDVEVVSCQGFGQA